MVRGEWPQEHLEPLKHSTTAEPLAVALVLNAFFEKGVDAKVLVISDNTAAVGELEKGYSTREGRFLSEHIKKTFKNLKVRAQYYEGEAIPTDEMSRGLDLDLDKLHALAVRLKLTVTDIREHCL